MEHKYLIENKKELIKLRKSTVKRFVKGLNSTPMKALQIENKALPTDEEDILYRTIIGNTYNWLDNHGDVHLSGCFTKTIKENTPFILADHKPDVTAKIGKALKTSEVELSWASLGIDKDGTTEALVSDVEIIKDLIPSVFHQYKKNMINQHSVGMQYVGIDLAINDSYDKEGYANWLKFLPELGNTKEAEECGYFWIVKEAKLFEISAVLQGSNELTGVLDNNNIEQQIEKIYKNFDNIEKFYEFCNNTLKHEPKKITQPIEPTKKNFYKHLIKI
jgi:hypothetical protein